MIFFALAHVTNWSHAVAHYWPWMLAVPVIIALIWKGGDWL